MHWLELLFHTTITVVSVLLADSILGWIGWEVAFYALAINTLNMVDTKNRLKKVGGK